MRTLRSKKDINPELLRWALLVPSLSLKSMIKDDKMYSLARNLKEALLGRQPEIFSPSPFFFICFIFF